jgi:UDP-glucose 4-epimerase
LTGSSLDFVQGSITDLSLLQKVFPGTDYIFHHAAEVNVPASMKNPIKTHQTNVTGTLKVLQAARDNKAKKVIFASSSAVYGDTLESPKREYMEPNPQSPYAMTKLAAEYYCNTFNKVYNLPTVSLRYFNVYGPRQNPNSQYAAVIPKFIKNISSGISPIIYGDGRQTRDFVHVFDVVSANLLAAESEVTGVFNIGSGIEINLNELANIVNECFPRKHIKPEYKKERPGDIKHSLGDITKARDFGFTPRFSLKDGLSETIKAFN